MAFKKQSIYGLAIALSLSSVMTSCDKRTPVEKANELVEKAGLKMPHFDKVDSVMGYQQAFSCRMASNNLYNSIETALWKSRMSKQPLSEADRKENVELADQAYNLEKQAVEIEIRERLKQSPQELVGFESPTIADSVSNDTIYTVYFDKDVTKILSIKKTPLSK